MIYREFKGKQLSALGMGCMRLPTHAESRKIDVAAVEEMVALAFQKGVNYFDTAWAYHGGDSESVMGEVLSKYPRESYYLADKFPGYDEENMAKPAEIFERQLEKCKTEYFDFYLLHNINEQNIEHYVNRDYKVVEYLLEQKKLGRIRHLGFSTHGAPDTMQRFLDEFGKDMEFCQIQLNWLDWKMQRAKTKVEMLRNLNIPIWVMEPVRGGKLAALQPEYQQMLDAVRGGVSAVEWAFRFLQSVDGVVMTLSGMSNYEQMAQNIGIYETEKPLTAEETEALFQVAQAMTEKTSLPCTACRYCTEYCPMGLDIPFLIELYNEQVYFGGGYIPAMTVGAMPDEKKPSACIGCGACEKACPQMIKVSEMMQDFTKRLQK